MAASFGVICSTGKIRSHAAVERKPIEQSKGVKAVVPALEEVFVWDVKKNEKVK